MQLRDLKASDRPSLEALLRGVSNLKADEVDVALELIDEGIHAQETTTYRFFVAVEDGGEGGESGEGGEHCLGYLCWGQTPMTARTVDLYWIVVDQALHGRGTGRRLLAALEDEMARLGLLTIRVETASSEAYGGTIAFYEKTDFSLSGRIADFYADGDDLLIFTKRVLSA